MLPPFSPPLRPQPMQRKPVQMPPRLPQLQHPLRRQHWPHLHPAQAALLLPRQPLAQPQQLRPIPMDLAGILTQSHGSLLAYIHTCPLPRSRPAVVQRCRHAVSRLVWRRQVLRHDRAIRSPLYLLLQPPRQLLQLPPQPPPHPLQASLHPSNRHLVGRLLSCQRR
jgi:hypothetical protein